jgi:hypothetical protein
MTKQHLQAGINHALPGVVTINRGLADPVAINGGGPSWKAGQHSFQLVVPGTGTFFARDGNLAEYAAEENADPEWIRLYLDSRVLVALLHQRKILNFHAGSFIHEGKGIMICGETGAGKSSLTVSFSLAGSEFLADDLTPVIFRDGRPYIIPMEKEIKLRHNTIDQLKIDNAGLREAESGTGKLYMKMDRSGKAEFPLNIILSISIGAVTRTEFIEPPSYEKFSLLRGEVCLGEMLSFMPETEKAYFGQLLNLVNSIPVIRVIRPAVISIKEFHAEVENFLGKLFSGVAQDREQLQ